ncbi:MAG TPA: hypothetical protein DCR40_21260 [Prolixibacteraceae bacterium]|nr:hypothetical protein [Prolixibacteraceae bacterium]
MSRHNYIHKNGGALPTVIAPTVEIVSITNITSNGATILARIVNDGGSSITSYQFFADSPGQASLQISVYPNGDGTFSYTFSTLVANVQYGLTAYAANSAGAGSAIQYFTTGSAVTVPTVRINSIGNITGISASVACELLSKGGGSISVSGICWNFTGSPTMASSKTTNCITEVGTFTSVMTGLQPNTTFYVKSYATNQAGTGYSAESNFLTPSRVLVLQFDTNCPPTKSFNPSIVPISGTYEWDLGNGTIVQGNSVSHTYANSNTKTVKLYCTSGTPSISDITIYNQYVIGMMDISHAAFASLVRVNIYQNPSLTGFALPTTITGAVEMFNISYNGIIGNIYLTALVNFNSSASICVNNNPITFVYFENTVSGLINYIDMRDCNIDHLASFAALQKWTDNATIILMNNPNLVSIIFSTNPHVGSLQSFDVRSCALSDASLGGWSSAMQAPGLVYVYIDNGMTAGEVNKLLWELNFTATSGSSGQIFIGGTNAPPDATSDNLNGLAYKASLISKGFQVNTN